MQKFNDSTIKPFTFTDLETVNGKSAGQFQAFEFKTLSGEAVNSAAITDEEIRSERNFAKLNNFKIDGIVQDYRGLSKQEQADFEKRINEEVKARLEDAFRLAYEEGVEKGREEAKAEAAVKLEKELAVRVDEFAAVVAQVKGQSEKLLEKNRQDIYDFVKRFTKWVVLKEINEKTYLESLLEKLILELNARKSLIIKVGQANFSQMPQVIQTVEARLGQLSNVRVEIVPEINHPGIILESENGLIDGSLEGVFQNIDKIFEQVGRHE
jgi:flagellar assembly protein FliH